MDTRFRVGTNRPTKCYAYHVSPISLLLKSYTHAFNDPHWYRAMLDEYNALIKNKTWILVPRPHNVNIVHCLWLFRHKHNTDGNINHYKARLVANGSSQLAGIDVDGTFSLVIKPTTIHTVLSLAISRHWQVHQLDVKNAFSNGYLSETVYMQQPLASSTTFLQRIITSLHVEFSMTDLRPFNYFWVSLSFVILPGCFSLNGSMLLRYLSVLLYSSTASTLVAYSDADWPGCPTTHRSTSGYCVFLGNNHLSWSSKRGFTISRSSAEAEYRGVANAMAETCWLHNLLRKLHTPLSTAALVYCDNYADILTKGLPTALFDEFRFSLSVHSSPAQTARGQSMFTKPEIEAAMLLIQLSGDSNVDFQNHDFSSSLCKALTMINTKKKEVVCDDKHKEQSVMISMMKFVKPYFQDEVVRRKRKRTRQQYEKLCLNGYTTRTMRNLVLYDLRRIMYMTKNDQKALILLNYNNTSTQPVLGFTTLKLFSVF
nr:ribonuclease H-like domain-containing protein [Tanacetum cinerariifolium]